MRNNKRQIKAVIFDLDGTLIDSDKDILKIINYIRKNYLNKKKIDINRIANYSAVGGKNLIKETINKKRPYFFLKIFRDLYKKQRIRENLIFPRVINLLKFLKKNKIKIFICTNKPKYLTSRIVKNTNLNKYVNKYFCSDEYNYKKPDKRFFLQIYKKMNVNKNSILFIGDSMVDYKFCRNCLLEFVLFKNKRIKYPKKIYHKLLSSGKILFNYKKINIFKHMFIDI